MHCSVGHLSFFVNTNYFRTHYPSPNSHTISLCRESSSKFQTMIETILPSSAVRKIYVHKSRSDVLLYSKVRFITSHEHCVIHISTLVNREICINDEENRVVFSEVISPAKWQSSVRYH